MSPEITNTKAHSAAYRPDTGNRLLYIMFIKIPPNACTFLKRV